jgi:hypothetical protein
VQIERTVANACELVLKEEGIPDALLKRRAYALNEIGGMFTEVNDSWNMLVICSSIESSFPMLSLLSDCVHSSLCFCLLPASHAVEKYLASAKKAQSQNPTSGMTPLLVMYFVTDIFVCLFVCLFGQSSDVCYLLPVIIIGFRLIV